MNKKQTKGKIARITGIVFLIMIFFVCSSYAFTSMSITPSPANYTNNATITVSASTVGSNERWDSGRVFKYVKGTVAVGQEATYFNTGTNMTNETTSVSTKTGTLTLTDTDNSLYTVIVKYQRKNDTDKWKDAVDVYEQKTYQAKVDKDAPILSDFTQTRISAIAANLTVKAVDPTPGSGGVTMKYLYGNHAKAAFATSGTAITSETTFMVMENGRYTIYAKDAVGNESLMPVDVTIINGRLTYTNTEFMESDSNTGSITTKSIVTLGGYRFKQAVPLVYGTDFVLNSPLPSGLTLIATVNGNNTVELSFTGSASSHAVANNFERNVVFNNSAFQGITSQQAAAIEGNGQQITVRFYNPSSVSAEKNDFVETDLNDGSVSGTRTIILTGTEVTTVGVVKGVMKENDHYTLTGLPAGLTAEVLRESNTRIVLKIGGKAIAHAASDSITNLQLTLKPAAFNPVYLPTGDTTVVYKVAFKNLSVLKVLEVYPNSILGGDGDFKHAFSQLNGTIIGNEPRYLKWEVTGRQGGGNGLIQVADLRLYLDNAYVPFPSTAIATNPGGSNPTNEEPSKVIDNNSSSKWLDSTFTTTKPAVLLIDLGVGQTVNFNQYSYVTANDMSERNPIKWNLYTSVDGSTWTKVDSVSETSLGTAFLTETKKWSLDAPISPNSTCQVTSMSLNKFISLTDQVNGNYDVIYFGKGVYTANDVTKSHYGNDITNLAASKVKSFIDGGQLVIFHEDSLTNKMTQANSLETKMKTNFNPYIIANKSNVVKVSSEIGLKAVINGKIDSVNRRPVLTMIKKPFSYRDVSLPLDSNNLEFSFEATDLMDPYVIAKLYIDYNSDGVYKDSELMGTHRVNRGKADSFYVTMPNGLTGIYAWKLIITDRNGAPVEVADAATKGASTEFADVFYLKGNQIEVNVLNIIPTGGYLDLPTKLTNPIPGNPTDTLGYKQGEYRINVVTATVAEFNSPPPTASDVKHLRNPNGYYSMILFGFKDSLGSTDITAEAATRIQSFINTKQSVMFTHDIVSYYSQGTNFDKVFKSVVGQLTPYSAGQIARTPDGVGDNNLKERYKLGQYNAVDVGDFSATLYTKVSKVNSTAMSLYPFKLEDYAQDNMKVAKTHYQYYKLDLENPNLIPVFNLYASGNNERVNQDAMNNYYTYSIGNITYSGTGHSNDASTDVSQNYPTFELQMFVNTMIKAYSSSNHAPVVEVSSPTNLSKIDLKQPTFNLVFTANDYDEGDETVKYAVSIDRNNNGNFVDITTNQTVTQVASTQNWVDTSRFSAVNLSIIKNFSNARVFKVKVEAIDAKGARDEQILELYNTQDPIILPSLTTDKTEYFVGETINLNMKLNATGQVTNTLTITNPSVSLQLSDKVTYNGLKGQLLNYNTNHSFVFGPTGPVTTTLDIVTLALIATDTPSATFTARSLYQMQAADSSVITVNPDAVSSIPVKIVNGQVNVYVKDTFINPLKDVAIFDKGVDTGYKTQDTGSRQFLGVARGNHNFGITLPTGYDMKRIEVTNLKDNTTAVVWDSSIPADLLKSKVANLVLTPDQHQWTVTYIVELNIPIPITYYQILPDNSVQLIGKDNGSGTVETRFDLKVKKGSKVKIVALMEIPVITNNEIVQVGIKMSTSTQTIPAVPITDPLLMAKIVGADNTAYPFKTVAGNVPLETLNASLRLIGNDALGNTLNPLKTTGTYSGQKYHVIIEIDKAEQQMIWLSEIKLKMSNTTTETIPKDKIKLNVKDLDIPLLQ